MKKKDHLQIGKLLLAQKDAKLSGILIAMVPLLIAVIIAAVVIVAGIVVFVVVSQKKKA